MAMCDCRSNIAGGSVPVDDRYEVRVRVEEEKPWIACSADCLNCDCPF
jgi:hypothetical protein